MKLKGQKQQVTIQKETVTERMNKTIQNLLRTQQGEEYHFGSSLFLSTSVSHRAGTYHYRGITTHVVIGCKLQLLTSK